MADPVVVYSAKVYDIVVGDLITLNDGTSVQVETATPAGSDVTITGPVVYDQAADFGYPSSVGEVRTNTWDREWILGSVTRAAATDPPSHDVTHREIQDQSESGAQTDSNMNWQKV
jgi:hypothetical protein